MYNLIVGAINGTVGVDRMLEHTDEGVVGNLRPGGVLDASSLLGLPTLVIPETGDTSVPQVARVGSIVSLTRAGRDFRYEFTPNPKIPEIPSSQIEVAAHALQVGDWEFHRSHWAVKDVDLYRVLFEERLAGLPSPEVFRLPTRTPDPDRVAVMMPFDAAFNPVWESLREAVLESGWRCQRADDIWENNAIIQDIVELIARSKVVVCDLTGKNANVFYEVGIAHTLGREVVLITQSAADVPFDLQHLRHIQYLGNSEGLEQLKESLLDRLRFLMDR